MPDKPCPEHWVTAPRHCSSLSSNKQHILVSRKGKRGTESFPVPLCCSKNSKLSHRQLVKPGCATSMCHYKHGHCTGARVHMQRQSTAHKEQHRPRSHWHNSTAWHHHARQRMSVCWGSPWAEASGAVTAPEAVTAPCCDMSPGPCFLSLSLPHSGWALFRTAILSFAQPSQALTPQAAVIQSAF